MIGSNKSETLAIEVLVSRGDDLDDVIVPFVLATASTVTDRNAPTDAAIAAFTEYWARSRRA